MTRSEASGLLTPIPTKVQHQPPQACQVLQLWALGVWGQPSPFSQMKKQA